MIFGGCNYCNAAFSTSLELGKVERIVCQTCGKAFFLIHSNFDPKSYRAEDVEVCEATKTVRIKA